MNDATITVTLTVGQATSAAAAAYAQAEALERLRQDMITNLSPQESIWAVARESKLLEEVGRMIKEAL